MIQKRHRACAGDKTGVYRLVYEYHKENCTFFVRGDVFRNIERDYLRIPSLFHAYRKGMAN